MEDLLGQAFGVLTRLGGGSELVPLLSFCVLLVLVGLGLGLAAMRLFGRLRAPRADSHAEAPH